MARSINEIKAGMTEAFVANDTVQALYGLNPLLGFDQQFSRVSLEGILFYIVAAAIWALEKLQDAHVAEVGSAIANLKPHSLLWYASLARAFQFGFALLPDSGEFDNSAATDDEVAASKVVAFTSVSEAETLLRVKVAGLEEGDLAPLSDAQLEGLKEYMSRVKDAGVRLEFINEPADKLRLSLEVWYDPLVLTATGVNIQTGQEVVRPAIEGYLRTLPFDGVVVLAALVDTLQAVPGVVIPHVERAEYKYAENDWRVFAVMHQPFSGYMRLDALTVTYKAR